MAGADRNSRLLPGFDNGGGHPGCGRTERWADAEPLNLRNGDKAAEAALGRFGLFTGQRGGEFCPDVLRRPEMHGRPVKPFNIRAGYASARRFSRWRIALMSKTLPHLMLCSALLLTPSAANAQQPKATREPDAGM